MKKQVIYTLVGFALAWGGWLIYRNNRNNQIDANPVSYDEAIKKLDEL